MPPHVLWQFKRKKGPLFEIFVMASAGWPSKRHMLHWFKKGNSFCSKMVINLNMFTAIMKIMIVIYVGLNHQKIKETACGSTLGLVL